ncbi:RRM 6 domain containing protein [Asbolus verrucosus]|uniref:RRM 6 domain containing protein n=1 Tax=Asbolus verrucosus TaxID=1661398 RepID=A0A482VA72_ASBVE|nr:RRM 6 domain containing protein [Asbolus verrucosus]
MVVGNTKVVQVTNIAPQATKDQMQTLFGYLGKIEDIRLYPTIRDVSCPVQSRICYVKFVDSSTVGVAQHMTNTVFIDRALIVIPVINGDIPDEYYALEMTRNGTIVPGFNVNEPKLPPHVSNLVQGTGEDKVIITKDPQLEDNGLAPYPPLPVKYDSIKVEETRRTIQVVNVDPSIPTDDFIQYFTTAGEVKYLRVCECPSDGSTHLLIEFSDQPSVVNALKMNGDEFKGKPLEIIHATQPIVKPQAKSNEAAQKEIEEAMSRFKEAQNMINASIEPIQIEGKEAPLSLEVSVTRLSFSPSQIHISVSQIEVAGTQEKVQISVEKAVAFSFQTVTRSRHKSKERDSRAHSHEKESKTRDRSKDRKREKDRKSKEKESSRSKEKESSRSKEKASRESKDKKSDKESSIECSSVEKKRSRSRSRSHRRSRSRDRKAKDKERRRSRSKARRKSPSPRSSKKRSRSKSRERKKDKKERKEKRERSRSRSKIPRNYDEEEKGFDSEKEKSSAREADSTNDKESSEKSDNMDISNSP